MQNSVYRLFELMLLFFGLPSVIALEWIHLDYILVPLYIVSIFALWWLKYRQNVSPGDIWQGAIREVETKLLLLVIKRFLITSVLLIAFVYLYMPDHMFYLPTEHTKAWLSILVFYPLLSVLPQEIVYRAFFFRRYRSFFSDERLMMIVSALCFGYMHVVFQNILGVIFTVVGGLYFAHTYQRSQSLRLVSFEHAIYGMLLFSIGYDEFLLYGNVLEAIREKI